MSEAKNESPDWRQRLRRRLLAGASVGLTGAAGTGKTTFAHYLSHTLGIPLHEEGVRGWLEERRIGHRSNITAAQVAELQLMLMDRLEEQSGLRLFERTAIDIIVYAREAGSLIDQEELWQRACRWTSQLELIVLFPYRSELLVRDGYRETDPLGQLQIEALLLERLESSGLLDRTIVFQHHRSFRDNAIAILEQIDDADNTMESC